MIAALRVPQGEDLTAILEALSQHRIQHQVVIEGDDLVLLVAPEYVSAVQQMYRALKSNQAWQTEEPELLRKHPRPMQKNIGLNSWITTAKRVPLTCALLILTLFFAALTQLGDGMAVIGWLNFVPFTPIDAEYVRIGTLAQAMADGQWWRWITPVFVHFGFVHLAMNSLWLWELSGRIERRQGPLILGALFILFACFSNGVQYEWEGAGIFGGLSGVVYAMLGHCWIYQRLAPNPLTVLPNGIVAIMLIWLVVCLTGVLGVVGLNVANGAHVGGLVIGCLTGLMAGLWKRRQG